MNILKGTIRFIGFTLLGLFVLMMFSALAAYLDHHDGSLYALLISAGITLLAGLAGVLFTKPIQKIDLKMGFFIVTGCWVAACLLGAVPFVLYGHEFTFVNALFESVSGFTTTGATILDNVEALPRSLLFWRSSTHFIGGLGVVVFLLLIIPDSSPVKLRLANMELGSLSRGAYATRTNRTVNIFAYVYMGIFALALLLYLLAGMPAFDALCHAMSVSATGGFSTRNASIGAFGSRWIEGITMLCMYLSSLHFGLLFLAVAGRTLKPLNNPVVKYYTGSILIASVLLGIGLKTGGFCRGWGESLWNGLFEVMCISSTTGFAIADNAQWPGALCALIMIVAVVCGCAGSTSGGLKIDRIVLMFKSLGRQIIRILRPSSVHEVKFGGRILGDEALVPHLLYIVLYVLMLAISTALCLWIGVDWQNSLAASITSLSNVGPALGEMGSMGTFNCAPDLAKLVFSLDMFIGRIEIYPVLAVVAMVFDKRSR